jgi:DNA-directed RNA polymerase subunit D
MSKFIKNLKITKDLNELQFDLVNTHQSYTSAIRRILMSEIPIYGLANFDIRVNTSNIFFDDMVIHIMSGIPILNLDNIDNLDNVTFTLKVDIPKDSESTNIYSNDIISSNNNIKLFQNIPIIKLLPGESLHIIIKPILDIAKKDAHVYGAIEVPQYKYIMDKNKFVGVKIGITAVRNYTAPVILKKSFEILQKKLVDLKNLIEITINNTNEIIDNPIRITEINSDLYLIEIDNCDHTLGNLIKCHIIDMFPDIYKSEFIGYRKIHPTQETVEFKLKLINRGINDGDTSINVFIAAIDELIILTKKIIKEL